jgi:hypothetical protein
MLTLTGPLSLKQVFDATKAIASAIKIGVAATAS